MNPIVSALPGRIRLRSSALRHPALLAALAEALKQALPQSATQTNVRTGSLLLLYDATRYETDATQAMAHRLAAEFIGQAAPEKPARKPTRKSAQSLMRANRYSKYGMFAALGVSLAAATVGATRVHAVTGACFVAAMGVHLFAHRRRLLA
ncbi:MAG: hypothetical protein LBB55_07520 [Zoogloeaceae bacterium]|jgi:hypothetical protein|nr:hypothetical protein [Zoogloeaceae bacterium]